MSIPQAFTQHPQHMSQQHWPHHHHNHGFALHSVSSSSSASSASRNEPSTNMGGGDIPFKNLPQYLTDVRAYLSEVLSGKRMFVGPSVAITTENDTVAGATKLEVMEEHVQAASSASPATTGAHAHPQAGATATESDTEPHIQHFSHLKRFTENAKSKTDDHMDANHLDFKHHKPKHQEPKKDKDSGTEMKSKKSPKKLIAKVMKVITAPAKPTEKDRKTTVESKFKRIVRSSIGSRLSNTVVKAVRLEEKSKAALSVSNTKSMIRESNASMKAKRKPGSKSSALLSERLNRLAQPTHVTEKYQPAEWTPEDGEDMEGSEFGRKNGGVGNGHTSGSTVDAISGRRSASKGNGETKRSSKSKSKNPQTGGAGKTTSSVSGKVKHGNWSMILSAALGLETKFDYMDKENAVNYSGGGTGTGTGTGNGVCAPTRKASIKSPKVSSSLKGSKKVSRESSRNGSQKGSPKHGQHGGSEEGVRTDWKVPVVTRRLEQLSRPTSIVDKHVFLKRREGDGTSPGSLDGGSTGGNTNVKSIIGSKKAKGGKSKGDDGDKNSRSGNGRDDGEGKGKADKGDDTWSTSKLMPRCLSPSETIAMQTRLRFHEMRKPARQMLPIEHRVSDALAGYFLSKINAQAHGVTSKNKNKKGNSKTTTKAHAAISVNANIKVSKRTKAKTKKRVSAPMAPPENDSEVFEIKVGEINGLFLQIPLDIEGNPICDAGLVEDYPPKWLVVGMCLKKKEREEKPSKKKALRKTETAKTKQVAQKKKKKKTAFVEGPPHLVVASPILVPVHRRVSKVLMPRMEKYETAFDGNTRVLRVYFGETSVSRILVQLKLYAPIVEESVKCSEKKEGTEEKEECVVPAIVAPTVRRMKKRNTKIDTKWTTHRL